MKVSIVEQNHIELDSGHGRTSGVHVSGIIRAIGLQMKFIEPDPEDLEDPFSPAAKRRIALGLAWEEWLSKRVPGLDYHFGEVVLDGIIMSPDGFSFMPDVTGVEAGRVHEFKLTWKSRKRAENWTKEWMWLSQMKAYCKALGCLECWLHVYWVNGDYSWGPESGPEYVVYGFEFTERELDDNWRLLLENAHKAEVEQHGD